MSKKPMWAGDYRALLAWGVSMGSFEPYIRDQQMKAFNEDAPIDAVYFREDKGWVRLKDCAAATQNNIKYLMGWLR